MPEMTGRLPVCAGLSATRVCFERLAITRTSSGPGLALAFSTRFPARLTQPGDHEPIESACIRIRTRVRERQSDASFVSGNQSS